MRESYIMNDYNQHKYPQVSSRRYYMNKETMALSQMFFGSLYHQTHSSLNICISSKSLAVSETFTKYVSCYVLLRDMLENLRKCHVFFQEYNGYFLFVCVFGLLSGGYMYCLKMYLFDKVTQQKKIYIWHNYRRTCGGVGRRYDYSLPILDILLRISQENFIFINIRPPPQSAPLLSFSVRPWA